MKSIFQWKPVKRYDTDPDPENPTLFEAQEKSFSLLLFQKENGVWHFSCSFVEAHEASLSARTREEAKDEAEELFFQLAMRKSYELLEIINRRNELLRVDSTR